MAISHQLRKEIEHGDYSRITLLYNEKNKKKGISVTSSYVRMIIEGERAVSSEKATEVVTIANRYLQEKSRFVRLLVAS